MDVASLLTQWHSDSVTTQWQCHHTVTVSPNQIIIIILIIIYNNREIKKFIE